MKFSEFMLEAAKVFLPILGTLASFLIAMSIEWIKTKTKNKKMQDYLDQLGGIVVSVVHEIQQTFVDNLKNPSKEGEWSEKQAKIALEMALEKVKAQLPLYVLEFLQNVYTDLDALISSKIEDQLYQDKSGILIAEGVVAECLTQD